MGTHQDKFKSGLCYHQLSCGSKIRLCSTDMFIIKMGWMNVRQRNPWFLRALIYCMQVRMSLFIPLFPLNWSPGNMYFPSNVKTMAKPLICVL